MIQAQLAPERVRQFHTEFSNWFPTDPKWAAWHRNLVQFFEWISATPEAERSSLEFQLRLWDANPVSDVGQGSISVNRVLEGPDFRAWLARESCTPLPSEQGARIARLQALYDAIRERVAPHCARTPWLKIYRVLAALFPGALTTVTDEQRLKRLYQALDGGPLKGVAMHDAVLRRLDAAVGPVDGTLDGTARRMMFAWYLWIHGVDAPTNAVSDAQKPAEPIAPNGRPSDSSLQPLPAFERRRGLSAFRGYFGEALRLLAFLIEGASREELLAYLQSENPRSKPATIVAVVNVLEKELRLIEKHDDGYALTDTGARALALSSADPLGPRVLTQIFGPDHVLVALRDYGPLTQNVLTSLVHDINPAWTSAWMPSAILKWLASFGWITRLPDGTIALTEPGSAWASRVTWTPEALAADPRAEVDATFEDPVHPGPTAWDAPLPSFDALATGLAERGHFDPELVQTLHAGLWAHPRRHFAVLSGISGSGKTLLATGYADAFLSSLRYPGPSEIYRLVVPVQPGWSDPTALLGYVNPLQDDTYVRTPALDLLLRSVSEPTRAFFLVLDEMNLSHPEQYMAPLLSAMETGDPIELHSLSEACGVPPRVPYPANLVIIGTVNMDETTHGLSDKVLDRALTFEFWNIDLGKYPRRERQHLTRDQVDRTFSILTGLMAALVPARLHFGWRVVDDILDFLESATRSTPLAFESALDHIVYAKVLPKLRGDDSKRFREALAGCAKALSEHHLPRSRGKVEELLQDLDAAGTARFWR